jgi:hypothetical protein
MEPGSGNLKVAIKDTSVHSNTNGGIQIKPAAGATVNASLTRVNTHYNLFGIAAQDGSAVSMFQSSATDNSNNGVVAVSAAAPADINVVNSLLANNGGHGVSANGAAATVRIANTAIVDNNIGIFMTGGGTVSTTVPATNLNAGNTTAGAPNASNALQ